MTETSLLMKLAEQCPALVLVGVFAFCTLRFLTTEAEYYRGVLDGVLGKILAVLDRLDERTAGCLTKRDGS
jgi:hypothetical protein